LLTRATLYAVWRWPYAPAGVVRARGLFKRSLLGYRRKSVEELLAALGGELEARERELRKGDRELAARERRIAVLDGLVDDFAGLVVARDRELRRLRAEIAELGALRAEVEALRAREREERRSRERVEREIAELSAQARGQATRIRMQALRHAARVAGRDALPQRAPSKTAAENGHAGGALDRFEGLIHLEIGPLRDFSQLVGFEDAANQIGATSEISVKRFSRGRATLALRLEQPVELLRELEERAPFEFRVRSLKGDRLILDLSE
jgi:DNA repair exonuclease SbcCD ATPase subunit